MNNQVNKYAEDLYDLHRTFLMNVFSSFKEAQHGAKMESLAAYGREDSFWLTRCRAYEKALSVGLNIVMLAQSGYRARCEELTAAVSEAADAVPADKTRYVVTLDGVPFGGGTLPESAARAWASAKSVVASRGGVARFFIDGVFIDEVGGDTACPGR